MIKYIQYNIIMIIAVFWALGCASLSDMHRQTSPTETSAVEYYQRKADQLMKKDELQLACNHLEIAGQLAPENKEIPQKLSELKNKILKKAESHFKKGVLAYNGKQMPEAQKEFLTVLRYFPEHKAALSYVKNKIQPDARIHYRIQKGDTAGTIAKKVYNNAELAFLVEYFIGSTGLTTPKPSSILSLPVLEKTWIQNNRPKEKTKAIVKSNPETQKLALAKKYFHKKNYTKVMSLTKTITEKNPDAGEAIKLYNYACYHKGKALFLEKQYIPAMETLNKVTMDLTDINQLKSDVKRDMEKQSETHYRLGVQSFINENLKQSIIEWEKALALSPENPKIQKAIENAKHLLQKLKNVK